MELFTPWHLLILAVVVGVLFFGSKQLPDMSRSLGRSLRVFKTEIKGLSDEVKGHRDDEHGDDGASTDATASGQQQPRELPAASPAAPAAVPTPPVSTAPAVPTQGAVRPPLRKAEVLPNPAAARTRPRPSPRPLDPSGAGRQ